ncbi:hypothetical protein cypCar_00014661 [Cyprinus carpio]|uniref:Si:ch73-343l4.8 n=2 Tax=Cyprinus carpio TaxID=7962 RepID=A0A8C1AYL9_CYPCA|nr:hypothetical protein cypCar_00014661 [Cyprinus carpio]
MNSGIYDVNFENRENEGTTRPIRQSRHQDEGKAQMCGGSRCLVLITVGLLLIRVLLLVFIILQHITITAERDLIKSYKNTVEEFNQTINSLQDNYTDLMIEKHQLQNIFNFVIQKKLELETKVSNLTTEKDQLQISVESLTQKKLELESRVTSLNDELGKKASKRYFFSTSSELKSWSDSRQYCRDHGGDLVIINTEEKQRHISSFIKESVWIGLSDSENEGNMKWVDNSPLNQGYWSPGEPNSFQGTNEDCTELIPTRDSVSNWNDLPCSVTLKWVCEI